MQKIDVFSLKCNGSGLTAGDDELPGVQPGRVRSTNRRVRPRRLQSLLLQHVRLPLRGVRHHDVRASHRSARLKH